MYVHLGTDYYLKEDVPKLLMELIETIKTRNVKAMAKKAIA